MQTGPASRCHIRQKTVLTALLPVLLTAVTVQHTSSTHLETLVVTGSQHYSACRSEEANRERNGGRRNEGRCPVNPEAGRCHGLRHHVRESFTLEPCVVPEHHVTSILGNQVKRVRGSDQRDIGASEIVGDHVSPAVGPESNYVSSG